LGVLGALFLAAVFASPARADLVDAAGAVVDQTIDVLDDTAITVIETDAAGDEESATLPIEEVAAEVTPSVSEEPVKLVEDVVPVVDDVLEVEGATSPAIEDLLVVVDVEPVVELVDDPLVEIVEEVGTVVADVVVMFPPGMVDVVGPMPLFVPATVASPGPIEVPTDPVRPTMSTTHEVGPFPQPIKDGSQRSSGLFTMELAAETTLFHLAELTRDSAARGSSASPLPERETAALAAYVPMAGTVPVVGGAGTSSSAGSSHSGGSIFGGLDAFSFFAAIAALLALCLVGWIRDRSRSGRSIFPSHGGRPG
jgi:hypothetical protein